MRDLERERKRLVSFNKFGMDWSERVCLGTLFIGVPEKRKTVIASFGAVVVDAFSWTTQV